MMNRTIRKDTIMSNAMVRTLVLGGALLAGACGADEPGVLPETAGSADVVVSRAASAAATESFPAALVAERRARIQTRTAGRIREVTVDVGSAVRAGQPLVVLDEEDVRARLQGAEAAATLAERSFGRVESLAADGAASEQELDEARARLDAARAAVREAANQLDYVVVRAPFDGWVESRDADPGDMAAPGRPLLTLVGGGDLQVEADLPSDMSGRVREGERVGVRVPGIDGVLEARVTRVAPALEPGSRRLRVEAVFAAEAQAGGHLVPGAYARLELAASGAGSVWIPEDAVVRRGQLTGVFQVTGGELRLRWLRLGRTQGEAVEVLAGPAGELTVVRDPAPTLRDGQPTGSVEVRPWSPAAIGVDVVAAADAPRTGGAR